MTCRLIQVVSCATTIAAGLAAGQLLAADDMPFGFQDIPAESASDRIFWWLHVGVIGLCVTTIVGLVTGGVLAWMARRKRSRLHRATQDQKDLGEESMQQKSHTPFAAWISQRESDLSDTLHGGALKATTPDLLQMIAQEVLQRMQERQSDLADASDDLQRIAFADMARIDLVKDTAIMRRVLRKIAEPSTRMT